MVFSGYMPSCGIAGSTGVLWLVFFLGNLHTVLHSGLHSHRQCKRVPSESFLIPLPMSSPSAAPSPMTPDLSEQPGDVSLPHGNISVDHGTISARNSDQRPGETNASFRSATSTCVLSRLSCVQEEPGGLWSTGLKRVRHN